MNLRKKYKLATDRLAFMIVYAPTFPPWARQTFKDAFEELCGYLDGLLATEKRGVSLSGIARSRQASLRAKQLFDAGEEDRGKFAVQYAYQYLEFAAKGRPAEEPIFQGSPPTPKDLGF